MIFNWDNAKNLVLKERGISFVEIVIAIEAGNTVVVLEHPNKNRYPDQNSHSCQRERLYLRGAGYSRQQWLFYENHFPKQKIHQSIFTKAGVTQ
jgi:hypothetical protein